MVMGAVCTKEEKRWHGKQGVEAHCGRGNPGSSGWARARVFVIGMGSKCKLGSVDAYGPHEASVSESCVSSESGAGDSAMVGAGS